MLKAKSIGLRLPATLTKMHLSHTCAAGYVTTAGMLNPRGDRADCGRKDGSSKRQRDPRFSHCASVPTSKSNHSEL